MRSITSIARSTDRSWSDCLRDRLIVGALDGESWPHRLDENFTRVTSHEYLNRNHQFVHRTWDTLKKQCDVSCASNKAYIPSTHIICCNCDLIEKRIDIYLAEESENVSAHWKARQWVNNARAAFSIPGLSARIHFSNSDLRWVSDAETLSTSRSSAFWNRLLAPWCSHAQNKCHVISFQDINLQVLVTSSRSMQEHAAKLTEQNAHTRECIS